MIECHRASILWLVVIVSFLKLDLHAQNENLPRMPGAVLLIGHAPTTIITTPRETFRFQESHLRLDIFPTISADGTTVAAAYVTDDQRSFTIGTYSLPSRRWTAYKEFSDFGGGIAITHDGSKLAFTKVDVSDPNIKNPRMQLHIIDLGTGSERTIVLPGRKGFNLSWSPDGRLIVYDLGPKVFLGEGALEETREIHIMDLETAKSTKIADGDTPVWSPSGEWIAFRECSVTAIPHRKDPDRRELRYGPCRLLLVRPNGSDLRVLQSNTDIPFPPVWSPDSRTLLVNKWRNSWWRRADYQMVIEMIDIATLKVTKKFSGVPPVYGWAISE